MAINFDALPNSKPTSFFKEPGLYKAKITHAEMRTPKTTEGKPYLSVTYELTNSKNEPAGKFFDSFFESDSEIPKWKIKRFIEALGITGLTTFELKDLTKVCVNKTILVDITTDRNDPEKNVVDVFTGDVYYPASEWFAKTATAEDILNDKESSVNTPNINAPDAKDAEDVDASLSDSEY